MKAKSVVHVQCVLGEGPVWYKDALWWVDIQEQKVFSWHPASDDRKEYQMPGRIGFAVPAEDESWIVGLQNGIHRWHPDTEKIELLFNPEETLFGNRFNDGKTDPNGVLWAGTMSMNGEPGAGSLYRIEGGQCTRAVERVSTSNGLAWNPARGKMYFIDTPTQEVSVFDYDPGNSVFANRQTAVRIPSEMGFPDGMTIDVEGCLWIALWGGSAVIRANPDNGEIISRVELPTANVTSCTFGGKELSTLYITTARIGLDEVSLKQLPVAGDVFAIEPGVRGLEDTTLARPVQTPD